MQVRRWTMVLAGVSSLGALAWLASQQSPAGTWVIAGIWVVMIASVLVRAMRPGSRGHRLRAAAGPASNGLDEIQALYLGRPDVGSVAYGSSGPAANALALDRAEPDPADLRHVDPGHADHRA